MPSVDGVAQLRSLCAMATTVLRTRVNQAQLAAAKRVLLELGLTPTAAVNALFAQIASRKALPFVLATPDSEYAAAEYGLAPAEVAAAGRRMRRAEAAARRAGSIREVTGADSLRE